MEAADGSNPLRMKVKMADGAQIANGLIVIAQPRGSLVVGNVPIWDIFIA